MNYHEREAEAVYCTVVCTVHTSTLAGCCTVQREKGT